VFYWYQILGKSLYWALSFVLGKRKNIKKALFIRMVLILLFGIEIAEVKSARR